MNECRHDRPVRMTLTVSASLCDVGEVACPLCLCPSPEARPPRHRHTPTPKDGPSFRGEKQQARRKDSKNSALRKSPISMSES